MKLVPLPQARQLLVPAAQVARPETLRVVMFVDSLPQVSTDLTLAQLWKRQDARILFIRPRNRTAQEWQDVAAAAAQTRPRVIVWLSKTNLGARYIRVHDDGTIADHLLTVLTPSGLASQGRLSLARNAGLAIDDGSDVVRVTGEASLAMQSASWVPAKSDAGKPTLVIELAGDTAGTIRFDLDVNEEDLTKLEADCRYFVRGDYEIDKFIVDEVRYPVASTEGAQPLSLRASMDPARDVEQLQLAFAPGARTRLHLQTDEGERIEVRAGRHARFTTVSRPSELLAPDAVDDRGLYFTLAGSFVIDPPASRLELLDGRAPRPFRLLLGLAGTEFVEIPDFDSGDAARTLSFELGDAFVDSAPWKTSTALLATDGELAERHTPGVRSSLAKTSWLRFHSAKATYHSQSQRAPLFGSENAFASQTADGAVRSEPSARIATLAYAPTAVAVLGPQALPFAPLAGLRTTALTAGSRSEHLLAASRVAPARLAASSGGALSDQSVASKLTTTPQGFLATVAGASLRSVQLATTRLVQTAGIVPPPDFALTVELPNASLLARELVSSEVLLAVSSWEAGTTAKALVAAEQWSFDLNVATASGGFETTNGIVLFKFHTGRLLDVINDPHTFKGAFNGSSAGAAAAQARVKDIIEPALHGPDEYWRPLAALLDDPKWTGIVMFNVRIATPPPELAGLVATMRKDFRVKYLAIPRNRVDASLAQRDGAVSGLIDYNDDEELTRTPYDLRVQSLRVLFVDSRVARFRCTVALKADQLFFVTTNNGQPNQVIKFEGQYEAHGANGAPTYTFQTADGQTFTFAFTGSSVLRAVTIRRLKYVSQGAVKGADGKSSVSSRITLRGDLEFDPKLEGSLGDIFSFDKLGFDDLALDVRSLLDAGESVGGKLEGIQFFAPNLTLDFSAARRLKSLLGKFPLQLKGFFARLTAPEENEDEDIWSLRGFLPMFTGPGKPPMPDFALVFRLDLGKLGALVDSVKGLAVDIAIGWKGRTPIFAMRTPEISGGEHVIGIQGILRLRAKNVVFHRSPKEGFFLLIGDGRVEVLGKQFPPKGVMASGLVIADADHRKPAWVLSTQWDAKNKQFVALGQSVRFAPTAENAAAVVQELRGIFHEFDFKPPQVPPQADDVLAKPNAKLAYAADHDWLLGVHLAFESLFTGKVDLILNDPTLYGVRVELGYVLDLLYRRVSDGVGMFHVETNIPGVPSIPLGALTLSLPRVALSILTDGGFKLDLGFPANMDFARGFHITMPPFGGAGGFYLARYARVGSDLLPEAGRYVTVLQAGIGFRMGYEAGLSVGPFSASASISVYAMLEGALGFVRSTELLKPDIAVRGRLGIIASLACHVDLVLTALDFALDVWAGIEVVLRFITGKLQAFDVTFEVGVRVRVRWVIARFKVFGKRIEISVTLSFERTIRYTKRIAGERNAAQALFDARSYAELVAAESAWQQTIPDPEHAPEPIDLCFVPEVSIGRHGGVYVIALLGLECSPAAEGRLHAAAAKWTAFDKLLRAVLRWAARADHFARERKPTPLSELRFTRETIRAWSERLGATHSTSAAGLTYAVARSFLRERLPPTIRERDESITSIATFPMFSELCVEVAGSTSRFDRSRYTANDEKLLEEILRFGTDRDPEQQRVRLADPEPKPLAELLFEEWFESLIKLGIDSLLAVATEDPATLDELLAKMRDPSGDDAFAGIASAATAQMLHGVHIPAPSTLTTTDPQGPSVYERTGQAVRVFEQVPPSFPGARSVALKLSAGASWPLPPVDVKEGMAEVGQFNELRVLDGLLRSADAAPSLPAERVRILPLSARRARSFALSTASPFAGQSKGIYAFPRELLEIVQREEPFPVNVQFAVADDEALAGASPEAVIDARWALELDVEIRRPPEKQASRNTFELLGVDERARRSLQRYLDRAEGAVKVVATLHVHGPRPQQGAPELRPIPAAGTFCVMTNTARRANPPSLSIAEAKELVTASIQQVDDFLRLLWRASVVRDGGFTLTLPAQYTDSELPAWNDAGRTALTLVVELGPAGGNVPRYANAITIPDRELPVGAKASKVDGHAPSIGYSLQYSGGPDDRHGVLWTPLAKPGRVTLELVRQDPDKLRSGLPTLGVPAGLSHEELRSRLAAQHITATDATHEAWLSEAEDPKVAVQLAYRLLAMRVRGEAPYAAYRRPLMPRSLEVRAPSDPAAFVEPAAAGMAADDWVYRTVVDLTTVLGTKQPYDLIGQNLDVEFAWRDGFGNEAPANTGWRWTQPLPIRYLDRLIPIGEWPCCRTTWTPAASASELLRIRVSYTPPEKGLTDKEVTHLRLAAEQVRRVAVRVSVSFAPNVPKLLDSETRKLSKLLEDIAARPEAENHIDLIVPRADLDSVQSRIELSVAITLVRDPALVTSGMPPEVGSVTTAVEATYTSALLLDFAKAFQKAYAPFLLAVGDADETDRKALWAVRRSVLDRKLPPSTPGQDKPRPRFFAPRPLSTELVTLADIEIDDFDADSATGARPTRVALRGLDPDLLLRSFLDDLETALRPDVFAVCRPSATPADGDAMDEIVRSKLRFAKELQHLVLPILKGQDETAGLADARAAFTEAVRRDLRQAYAVDSIVQYELSGTKPSAAEMLYGDLVHAEGSTPSVELSRARIWLCPESAKSTVTVLVDETRNNDPSGPKPPYVDLALNLQITHLAQREDGSCGDDIEHYLPMRWLRLVEGAREIPLQAPSSPLRVPLPVRIHPMAPTVRGHEAVAAPPSASIADAGRWIYRVEYAHEGAIPITDRLLVTAKFERYALDAAQLVDTTGPEPLDSLVAALAGWKRSSRDVLAVIEAARSGGAPKDVYPAYRYISRVADRVATALEQLFAGGRSLRPTLAGEVDHLIVPTTSAPWNGAATPSQRIYSKREEGKNWLLSVGEGATAADRLDVLDWVGATAELRIDRNAELLPNLPSRQEFVYTTERVAAGDWVRPLVEPDTLFRAEPIENDRSTERVAGMKSAIARWLRDLARGKVIDVTIAASFAFEPSGRAPATVDDLGGCTLVPLTFVPSAIVGSNPDGFAQELTDVIDRALAARVTAVGAGVLLDVTFFTHTTAGRTAATGMKRAVLRLRGLWIPFRR